MNPGAARKLLKSLYQAALEGVDPCVLVARALGRRPVVRALDGARRVGVFAVGKAAAAMMRGAADCGSRRLAVLPRGTPSGGLPAGAIVRASHPEPDRSSLAAARRALVFFRSFGPGDLILCLVSGGTSSLLALPRRGVTLEAKRRAVARLAAGGANILQLNRLRTRLSLVKGGGLGRATRARLVTLILSDVPGDRPEAVGSGPTVRGRRGDLVLVVGNNSLGLEAAAARARRSSLSPRIERARLAGEAREAGASFARRARRLGRGEVLLAGGETSVALGSPRGRGGRSLEFALGASREIQREAGLTLLCAGSDGRDGSSQAAGAFADGTTLQRAEALGLDFGAALDRHDSEALLRRLGDLFVTGPTGTNVADWAFAARA